MTNLIRTRESTRYPGLFVNKYVNKVFYKNLWNDHPDLVESRGRVTDADGNVVIRPFTKIFNRFENDTNIPDNESCLAIEKINGFMAAVTWIPSLNKAVVSTTGSLDSEYAIMAEQIMPRVVDYVEQQQEPVTYLFEIVHPSDPHIIPENIGVYLIGERTITDEYPYGATTTQESWLDFIACRMRVARPSVYELPFSDIVQLAKTCKHEGYVVYSQESDKVLKIKSPYYLALKATARRKDILSLDITRIDEEFYPLLAHLKDLGIAFSSKPEQERLTYIRDWLLHN
jgi:hypothetical protein